MARLSERKVIDAIEKANGNVSVVAKSFNVSRTTMYVFLHGSEKAQEALSAAREKMIDNVESALYSQALLGNTTAMIFFLKTQGKQRGYIERTELTGAEGKPIQFVEVEIPSNDE